MSSRWRLISALVLVLLGLTGCSPETHELFVDLRTDLVPGTEFDEVRAELREARGTLGDVLRASEEGVFPSRDYAAGQRVAEWNDLATGIYIARLELRRTDTVVIDVLAEVELTTDRAVAIFVGRDCLGRSCPALGDDPGATTCLRGTCVPPSCVTSGGVGCAGPTDAGRDADGAPDSARPDGGPLDLADDAESDFEAGTFEGMRYGGGVVLDSATSGRFTSRVIERPAGVWDTIHWVPAAPYGKPLPDAREPEVGYLEGNLDMGGNIVLLHLDEGTPYGEGDLLLDSSGADNHFLVTSSGSPGVAGTSVPGVFGQAIDKDQSQYARHDIDIVSDLQFGTDDFTWSVWARPTRCVASNSGFWGTEDADISPHIWMGCGPCSTSGNHFNGAYRGDAPPHVFDCVTTHEIIDGEFHLLVVVKRTVGSGVGYSFYYDGVLEAEITDSTADPIVTWTPPVTFNFLAFETERYPNSPAEGTFDEGAIWRRGLSASEIASMWERGALDLALRVRFCGEADCRDGGPFVGPDGTEGTAFRDDLSSARPPAPRSLDAVGDTTLPYAQYQVTAATRRSPETPRLVSVTFAVR